MRTAVLANKDDQPWTLRQGIQMRGFPMHCQRSVDVVNVAWLYRLEETGALTLEQEEIARVDYFVDFGQAVQNSPWGEGLQTLCKGQRL